MALLAERLPFKRVSLLKFLLLSSLFIFFFFPVYKPLLERFNATDSYYSHGYLVPFISIYLIWRKRFTLNKIVPAPHPLGIFVLLIGVFMHLLGVVLKINFISYFAIPFVLLGLSIYLRGVEFTREILFPIVFLIFMLPLPRVLIIGITFKLKLLVAQWATFIGNAIGIEATRSGSTIYYPGGYLLVGDPCSGLRSLLTFIALGALLTQFTKGNNIRKIILFLSSIPIALLSNLARITFLLFMSYVYGEKVALGFMHELSGVVIFILGFMGLIGVSKAVGCHLSLGPENEQI